MATLRGTLTFLSGLVAVSMFSFIFVSDLAVSQMKAMADDIKPLLAEVHDSGLLKEVENLTKSLTLASEDLRWKLLSSLWFQI